MTKDFNDSASFSNKKNKEELFNTILDFKLNCKIFLCRFAEAQDLSFSIKYTSMLHAAMQLVHTVQTCSRIHCSKIKCHACGFSKKKNPTQYLELSHTAET